MKLKRSGNQWIRTDVLGVLAYAAFLLVLFAFYLLFACADGNRKKAKSGNDDDPREQVSAGSGLAGATQPGSVASASTDGRVPDLIHTIKESLLDRAVPGTQKGIRYVDLAGKSGLWALDGPEAAQKARYPLEGKPIPLHDGRVKLVFNSAFVEKACLHAAIEAKKPTRLTWTDSRGERGISLIDEATLSVALDCPKGEESGEFFSVSLALKQVDGVQAAIRGIWIVPQKFRYPAELPVLERCEAGEGWTIEPGGTLFFTGLAGAKSRIAVAAEGPGADDFRIRLLYDPVRSLPLTDGVKTTGCQALGTWELPFKEPTAFRVEIGLPDSAGGPVCLGKLLLRHRKAAPALSGDMPDVEGVVFILVDTLRADSLGFLNPSTRVAAPKLTGLASRSVVFESMQAQSHYTKASVGTILTGHYPGEHGGLLPKGRLTPSIPLLSELLKKQGVDTQAIFSNFFLNNRKFGFQRGWNFKAHVNSHAACLGGEPVAEKVKEWAKGWEPGGPFFVYIHLMDPHAPYSPPPAYELEYLGFRVTQGRIIPIQTASFLRRVRRGDVAQPNKSELKILKGLYDADVAHADQVAGRVIDILREAGILDRALLIVTSDHGEEFMEHSGLGHGTNLHRELIHLPLLMRWPGDALKGTVGVNVGHVDFAPTVLDTFDIPVPPQMKHGRSLLGLLRGEGGAWQLRAYMSEHKNGTEKGVIVGKWKLLQRNRGSSLSRLSGTAGEKDLPVEKYPITWRLLRCRLIELLSGSAKDRPAEAVEVKLAEDELEKLKAIGYIME